MATEESCGNCKYFIADLNAVQGHCRAHAPLPLPSEPFSKVRSHEWCGEWESIGSTSPSTPSDLEEWISGNGPPGDGIGKNGDFYLDNQTGNVYEKVNGTWG